MSRAEDLLDCYDEYRVSDQQRFYGDRISEYEAANRHGIYLTQTLLVAASVCGLLAGLDVAPRGLGIAAAALGATAALVEGWARLIGFGELATRYAAAVGALTITKAKRPRAEDHPSDSAARAYVAECEKILLAEVSAWGEVYGKATTTESGEDSPDH